MFSSRLLRKEVARQVQLGRGAFSGHNLNLLRTEAKGSLVRSFSSQKKEWQDRGVLDENGLTAFSTIRKFILFCI